MAERGAASDGLAWARRGLGAMRWRGPQACSGRVEKGQRRRGGQGSMRMEGAGRRGESDERRRRRRAREGAARSKMARRVMWRRRRGAARRAMWRRTMRWWEKGQKRRWRGRVRPHWACPATRRSAAETRRRWRRTPPFGRPLRTEAARHLARSGLAGGVLLAPRPPWWASPTRWTRCCGSSRRAPPAPAPSKTARPRPRSRGGR